jgi:hypothetical protein
MFFLPKLAKPLEGWRIPYEHPKFRPIIADTPSLTYKLSKYILKTLQIFERQLTSVITNPYTIADHISQLKLEPNEDITLITVDVESLFTNIPLPELCNIIKNLLTKEQGGKEIFTALKAIIYNNFFLNK